MKASSISGDGKIGKPHQDCYMSSYTKDNSKMTKDINMRSESIKYIDRNMGIQLMDLGLRGLNLIPEAREIKAKITE